jgi:hypothetical protein
MTLKDLQNLRSIWRLKMSKKIGIPELRFAGFDDGWEQKRLS